MVKSFQIIRLRVLESNFMANRMEDFNSILRRRLAVFYLTSGNPKPDAPLKFTSSILGEVLKRIDEAYPRRDEVYNEADVPPDVPDLRKLHALLSAALPSATVEKEQEISVDKIPSNETLAKEAEAIHKFASSLIKSKSSPIIRDPELVRTSSLLMQLTNNSAPERKPPPIESAVREYEANINAGRSPPSAQLPEIPLPGDTGKQSLRITGKSR